MLKKFKRKALELYLYRLPLYQLCFEFELLKTIKPKLVDFFETLCEEGEIRVKNTKFYFHDKVLYAETDEEIIEIPNLKKLEKILFSL